MLAFLNAYGLIITLVSGILTIVAFVESRRHPAVQRPGRVASIVCLSLFLMALSASGMTYLQAAGGNNVEANPQPTSSNPEQGTGSTPTPTPRPSPTPSPTPVPKPGDILYQAGQSDGWDGWSGTSDWQVFNDMLVNHGTLLRLNQFNPGPTIAAPYQVGGTVNYAIEAKMQVISYQNGNATACFGITTRGTPTQNSWNGYHAIVGCTSPCCGHDLDAVSIEEENIAPFDPGNTWHIYRVEVNSNDIKFFVDGALKSELTDNKYLSGGQVGLFDAEVQLNVSSFKVIAL